MSSGTFAAFSKFHLNTSKSTNMKVVQFVDGHNFHVDWHFKFWVEKDENVVNWQQPLFIEIWRLSKFGCILCKIRWEKHPRAFVKVVESSEIYNFPVRHIVHFYSNVGRKSQSNQSKLKQANVGMRHWAALPSARGYTDASIKFIATWNQCLVLHFLPKSPISNITSLWQKGKAEAQNRVLTWP
jgi:hypothetical protein